MRSVVVAVPTRSSFTIGRGECTIFVQSVQAESDLSSTKTDEQVIIRSAPAAICFTHFPSFFTTLSSVDRSHTSAALCCLLAHFTLAYVRARGRECCMTFIDSCAWCPLPLFSFRVGCAAVDCLPRRAASLRISLDAGRRVLPVEVSCHSTMHIAHNASMPPRSVPLCGPLSFHAGSAGLMPLGGSLETLGTLSRSPSESQRFCSICGRGGFLLYVCHGASSVCLDVAASPPSVRQWTSPSAPALRRSR